MQFFFNKNHKLNTHKSDNLQFGVKIPTLDDICTKSPVSLTNIHSSITTTPYMERLSHTIYMESNWGAYPSSYIYIGIGFRFRCWLPVRNGRSCNLLREFNTLTYFEYWLTVFVRYSRFWELNSCQCALKWFFPLDMNFKLLDALYVALKAF